MSQTLSIGVVGPRHWAYMAHVMASRLERVIATKRTETNAIPRGVYEDAKEFFRLVLQAAGDALPDNPPASVNNYVIATEAVRAATQQAPTTRAELREILERFAQLLNSLSASRELSREELALASQLQRFFRQLQYDGEIDAYERSVTPDFPHSPARMA